MCGNPDTAGPVLGQLQHATGGDCVHHGMAGVLREARYARGLDVHAPGVPVPDLPIDLAHGADDLQLPGMQPWALCHTVFYRSER